MTPAPTPRPRLHRLLLTAGSGLGVACLALGAGVAQAAPVAPPAASTPAAATPTATPAEQPQPAATRPPTPAEVEAARRAAAASATAAVAAQQRLDEGRARLDVVAEQANAALELYQQAVEARQAAQLQEVREQQRLDAADAALSEGREDLGQWVAQTYRGSGNLQQYSGLITLLQRGGSDDATQALATTQRITAHRSNAVTDFETAQRAQAAAARSAAEAAEQTRVRAEEATAAKRRSDALVAEQKDQVASLTTLQAAAAGTAVGDATRAQNLATARAVADAEAAAAARAAAQAAAAARAEAARAAAAGAPSSAVVAQSPAGGGDCGGSSTAGYPNGLIPRSALCPLWGASGHVLRSDAAAAFNQLSQAYAEQFSRPICVTDSYRTLAEQIDVKRRKPGLAATPGTSRHGLGIAVDLGCGVQDFGSPQFTWLKRNAALYGWLHPAWAERQNGPFEPWHWEYTG